MTLIVLTKNSPFHCAAVLHLEFDIEMGYQTKRKYSVTVCQQYEFQQKKLYLVGVTFRIRIFHRTKER